MSTISTSSRPPGASASLCSAGPFGASGGGDDAPAAFQVFLGQSKAKAARGANEKQAFVRFESIGKRPFAVDWVASLGERRLR